MTPYLTPSSLAERWHCSPGHLANLRSLGSGVRYVKVGRSVLYPLDAVQAYESANTVEPLR